MADDPPAATTPRGMARAEQVPTLQGHKSAKVGVGLPGLNHTEALCWVFGVTEEVLGTMEQKALERLEVWSASTQGGKSKLTPHHMGTKAGDGFYPKVGGDTYHYITKKGYDCCRDALKRIAPLINNPEQHRIKTLARTCTRPIINVRTRVPPCRAS